MKRRMTWKMGICWLACCGMILPAPALQMSSAQEISSPQAAGTAATTVVDVELRPGGVLLGQAIGANGMPLPSTAVSVQQANRPAATATTDQAGYFLVRDLRGGVYEITAGEAHGLFRLWAPGTAPPLARPGALVLTAGAQVRGQDGPIAYWLSKPFVLFGLVAGAVAVPVIIHNSRKHAVRSP